MKKSESTTYLKRLYTVFNNNGIFFTQPIFYQVLISFSSNQDNIATRFLTEIQNCVKNNWENKVTNKYDNLHSELLKFFTGDNQRKYCLKAKYNPKVYLQPSSTLSSGINAIINGERRVKKEWKEELKKYSDDLNILIYRMFWILQYFFSMYTNSDLVRKNVIVDVKSNYAEYYQLNPLIANAIKNELINLCEDGSAFLNKIGNGSIDNTRVLARIIFEIICKHNECIDFEGVIEELIFQGHTSGNHNIEFMKNEYNTFVDIYDRTTMDWFHVCEKYADKNCVAATELGNLYFSGAKFRAGEIFILDIEPDYKKAAELYKSAIEMTEEPYAPACWNMGYMLSERYATQDNVREDINKLALEYFNKAGEYAPAYNSKARMILKDTDEKYAQGKINYKEAVTRYAEGLQLAYQASEWNWFYGNNIIANFILMNRSREDKRDLISDIEKITDFPEGLNAEFFLTKSAEYKNPWALYMLGVELILKEKFALAKEKLEMAKKLNYYFANCPLAIHFYEGEEQKQLLIEASENGCALATYEYAIRYCMNGMEERRYLNIALNQLYTLRVMDVVTFNKVSSRIELLNNDQSA